MVTRNRKHGVSHPSYSLWEQKPQGQEFSRTFFIQWSPTTITNINLPESENFQKTGRKTASFQDHCVQVVLHWEMHKMHQMHQFNVSQQEKTLGNQPRSIVANYTYKDTIATWISGFPIEIVEL